MVDISEINKSFFPLNPPNLSFCAEPKAKSQNPSSNITLADGERVDVEDVGEGQTKILFFTPHPP